jgi:arylsulfatase A-like enzyme
MQSFVTTIGFGLWGLVMPIWLAASLSTAAQDQSAASQPNILLIIADDWSWPHAGAYGDKMVKTPAVDRLARNGVLFTHAFCASPSCTPSRGAILTGQAIHRLEAGGNLWGILSKTYATYPDLLEQAGYWVGFTRKGWGPGSLQGSGRTRNPAGPSFKNFAEFLKRAPDGKPFCFWFGSQDPHRPYDKDSGLKAGMKLDEVVVPPFLPDAPEVRSDILDYYFEVQRFDRELGELVQLLETNGLMENTIVVITSDNGMPFPRAKTNLYDSGTRMPLLIHWPAKVKGGRIIHDLVSLADLAPTFLEAAGLRLAPDMTGKSLLGFLTGQEKPGSRDRVFLERERHANVRKGDLSYPVRAIRTRQFLYVRNLRPDRWPGGDPEMYQAVGPFGDCDNSPTKSLILDRRDDPQLAPFFRRAFAKRPADELYDLASDPWQINNVASQATYAQIKEQLWADLERWRQATADPRLTNDDDRWDRYPYFGDVKKAPGRGQSATSVQAEGMR